MNNHIQIIPSPKISNAHTVIPGAGGGDNQLFCTGGLYPGFRVGWVVGEKSVWMQSSLGELLQLEVGHTRDADVAEREAHRGGVEHERGGGPELRRRCGAFQP